MTVDEVLEVLVSRSDADRNYSDREHTAHPTSEDVANWCVGTGLDHDALFDQLGLALARGYADRSLSFTVCDFVVNDLHSYLDHEDLSEPDVFRDVYLAFDAGEYFRTEDRHDDPEEEHTRPRIRALLNRVAET